MKGLLMADAFSDGLPIGDLGLADLGVQLVGIDYLSIDTEGGELNILQSIDFDKVTIYIIDVENNYNDPNFKLFLESKGYRLVAHLEFDEIYQKL